ncbi:amino acid adenylation domain-containing protein [Corynebacterium sp. zg-331]|uniref:amino acid adenylation domain-containing protein n=1 Tax=unclassified Corynebacterium TaxID=2624378 RepID=UPI00128B5DE2|nr:MULTISPECIES: amino acid adenylation domain-containing protein [unclassified Corynebacterium]MBC3185626.1 amino acid adenylation domain-containing protein [Corynebacterium sp. zg-331]MPV52120.1 amino acid adenylation domain-containing protein [Corynebacterium sp. zg331]
MDFLTTDSARTVTELLERTLARRTAEEEGGARGLPPAIVVDAGAGGEAQILTYARLCALSGALARRLVRAGVAPGTRVAVVAGRSAWQAIAAVAILRAGAVYVPVDRDNPAARIEWLLGDCAPAAVLYDAPAGLDVPALTLAPSLNLGDPAIREDLAAEAEALGGEVTPARPVTGDDPVYVIYTSGTTGTPKGAINLHRGVAHHLGWMAEAFGGEGHTVLNKAPVSFDVGVAEMLSPLASGGTVVIPPPDWWPGDSLALAEMVARHEVTVMSLVPSMMRALLDAGPRPGALSALRHLLLGGEAVAADLVSRVREVTPARIHGLYGPSETAMDVMWVEYTPEVPLRPGQCLLGLPEPGVGLRVIDPETSERVRPGEVGELVIAGVQVGGGYFRRPELTAAAFLDDPEAGRMYRTGDLVRFDEELGMYEFRGRIGEQVKVRGNRVELGEVEATLLGAPGVTGAACLLVGEELWGYVTGEVDPDRVRAHLRGVLPGYAVPGRLVRLERLPLGRNGKLDKSALPQQR